MKGNPLFMQRNTLFITATLVFSLFLAIAQEARAQTSADADDPPKLELGVHFTSLSLGASRTEPGLGARLSYNATKYIALEAEADLLPRNSRFGSFRNGGRAGEGLFGVKAGRRFEKFGIFGKVRPGLISFAQGRAGYVSTGQGGVFPFEFRTERATHFATDIGGVLEFYPSRRIVTRFDAGDTIIRYGRSSFDAVITDGSGNFTIRPLPIPAETTHNFQFTAGVGFRF